MHSKNIKKQFIWGTTTEIIAGATLFQIDVYVATDSYRPGSVTWLLYSYTKTSFTFKEHSTLEQTQIYSRLPSTVD